MPAAHAARPGSTRPLLTLHNYEARRLQAEQLGIWEFDKLEAAPRPSLCSEGGALGQVSPISATEPGAWPSVPVGPRLPFLERTSIKPLCHSHTAGEVVCVSDSAYSPPPDCQLPLARSQPKGPPKSHSLVHGSCKYPLDHWWEIPGALLQVGWSHAGHWQILAASDPEKPHSSWKEFPFVHSRQACFCFISTRGSVPQKRPAKHSCFQRRR